MKINKKTVSKKSVKKEISKLGRELSRELKNLKGTVTIGKFTITKN